MSKIEAGPEALEAWMQKRLEDIQERRACAIVADDSVRRFVHILGLDQEMPIF